MILRHNRAVYCLSSSSNTDSLVINQIVVTTTVNDIVTHANKLHRHCILGEISIKYINTGLIIGSILIHQLS